jgi:hypothetical protein
VDGTSTLNDVQGGYFMVDHNGTGLVDYARGVQSVVATDANSTITTGFGLQSSLTNNGTIDTYYAINVTDVVEGNQTDAYAFWTNEGDMVLDGDGDGIAGGTHAGSDLFFGENQDAAIWYDGTDLQVNPQKVGTGDVVVSSGNIRVQSGGVFPPSLTLAANSITASAGGSEPGTPGDLTINGSFAGDILLATGGGNVGIGTTNPQAKLAIGSNSLLLSQTGGQADDGADMLMTNRGVIAAEGHMFINADANNDGNGAFYFNKGSNNAVTSTNLVAIKNSGNVGIGTSNPTGKLHIKDDGFETIHLEGDDSISKLSTFIFSRGAGEHAGFGSKGDGNGNVEYIFMGTKRDGAGVEADIVVDGTSGNVGIGTSTPGAELHVVDSGGGSGLSTISDQTVAMFERTNNLDMSLSAGTAHNAQINFGDADDENIGRIQYNNANDAFTFRTNATDAMVIDSSGNVGIGATEPDEKLDVSGTVKAWKFVGTSSKGPAFVGDGSGLTNLPWEKIETTKIAADKKHNRTYFKTDGIEDKMFFVRDAIDIIADNASAPIAVRAPAKDFQDADQIEDEAVTMVADEAPEADDIVNAFNMRTDYSLAKIVSRNRNANFSAQSWSDLNWGQGNPDTDRRANSAFYGWHAGGTRLAPTSTKQGNSLVGFFGGGRWGTDIPETDRKQFATAGMRIYAEEEFTDEDHARTSIVFTTSERFCIPGQDASANGGDCQISHPWRRGRVHIKSDGKVGIGTSNPGALLDVAGDTNVDGHLAVGSLTNVNEYRTLNINENLTGDAYLYGIYNNVKVTQTPTANKTDIGTFSVIQADDVNENGFNVDMRGVHGEVQINGNSTLNDVQGGYFMIDHNGSEAIDYARGVQSIVATDADSTITTGFGLQSSLTNNGTIDTYYAINVTDVVEGNQTDAYAFWTNEGDMVLDGDGDGIAGGTHAGSDLFFGENQDAAIWYDGTDLQINPQVAGDGNIVVPDGNIKLENGALRIKKNNGKLSLGSYIPNNAPDTDYIEVPDIDTIMPTMPPPDDGFTGIEGDVNPANMEGYPAIFASGDRPLYIRPYSANNIIMLAKPNGKKVGIGTESPQYKLDVNGTGRFNNLKVEGGTIFLNEDDSGGGYITEAGLEGIGLAGSNGSLSAPDLYVTNDGNVGIGTTNPSASLDVVGNLVIQNGINFPATITIDTNSITANSGGGVISPGKLILNGADSGNVLLADNGGKVGIGTDDPQYTLDIDGSVNMSAIDAGRGDVYVENNTHDNADGAGITLRSSTNPTSDGGAMFAVRSAGNAARLWVGQAYTSSGSNHFYVGTDTDGHSNPAIQLKNNGDATFNGSVTVQSLTESSDARLKTDIRPLKYSAEELLKLEPRSYKWIKDGKEDIGVIAQEVEAIVPELVVTKEDGYKAVDYPKLTAALLQIVKDLDARVQELEKQ